MKYKCKTVSLNQLLITPLGVVEPLCNSCKSTTCSNPIMKKNISIMGFNKEYRLFLKAHDFQAVVECNEGYMKDEGQDLE